MQVVHEDGSVGPIQGLTPGKELEEIAAALDGEGVAEVRVGRAKLEEEVVVRKARGLAKARPRRWKKKKRRRRKDARARRKGRRR